MGRFHEHSLKTSNMNDLQKVKTWIESIGIPVRNLDELEVDDIFSFIDNIKIYQGVLYINEKTHAGDLLHEAGHIATTPSELRKLFEGDLGIHEDIKKEYYRRILKVNGFDSDEMAAYINQGESAAIAWSYAAAIEAGVDSFLPFENGFDKDEAIALHLSLNLSENNTSFFTGVNSLVAGKMLDRFKNFPKLKRWIQI